MLKKSVVLSVVFIIALIVSLSVGMSPRSEISLANGLDPTPIPSVTGPIPVTATSYPFLMASRQHVPIELSAFGYVEEEYFVSGTANVYDWPGAVAVPTGYSGPYTTRILVRKPANPNKFSGNVVVELFNWALGYDWPYGMWGECYEGILDRGDAWVGITIRPSTVLRLKNFNPTRYAPLSFASPIPEAERCPNPGSPAYPYPPSSILTEDGLAWDIISQVGALLKSTVPSNPLSGYNVEYVYATGATGGDLSAYVAAIHPLATIDGSKPVYDGYLIKCTGAPGLINQCAEKIPPTDPRCKLSANVPIIRVLTQGDLFGFLPHPDWSCLQRRPDSDDPADRFRLYEVAGATLGMRYTRLSGPCEADVLATGEAWSPVVVSPYEFPFRYILNGAFVNLDKWVRYDIPPPRADRMQTVDCGLPTADFLYDALGNVLGGVRTPYVDVPICKYPKTAGAIIPFTEEQLAELYKNHGAYVNKVVQATNQLVQQCWITNKDAKEIRTQAVQADVP